MYLIFDTNLLERIPVDFTTEKPRGDEKSLNKYITSKNQGQLQSYAQEGKG